MRLHIGHQALKQRSELGIGLYITADVPGDHSPLPRIIGAGLKIRQRPALVIVPSKSGCNDLTDPPDRFPGALASLLRKTSAEASNQQRSK